MMLAPVLLQAETLDKLAQKAMQFHFIGEATINSMTIFNNSHLYIIEMDITVTENLNTLAVQLFNFTCDAPIWRDYLRHGGEFDFEIHDKHGHLAKVLIGSSSCPLQPKK
jgi:hypothetical protein